MIGENEDLTLQDKLEEILELRFGGLDFWRSSKRAKQLHYKNVSSEIIIFFALEGMKYTKVWEELIIENLER